MDVLRHPRLVAASLAVWLALGCTPAPGPAVSVPPLLNPYLTATPALTPSAPVVATDIPIPTSTPSTYAIVRGDTLSSIAEHFSIRLDDLLAANPGIVPEALSVGQTLKIPAGSSAVATDSEPTSAAGEIGPLQCYPAGAGSGLYCLAALHNPFAEAFENIKLQMSLLDPDGKVISTQVAFVPLNILPAGGTLPAYAFFPGASLTTSHPVAQWVSSNRLSAADARYLPALVRNLLVSVDWNGRSAQVQGQVFLPAESRPARTVWLAAVAYDVDGQMIGFRRWEWKGDLQPGGAQPFSFFVYSLGPVIEKVDVVVEARP